MTDEEHAKRVKDAVDALNRAVGEATGAGLTVAVESQDFRKLGGRGWVFTAHVKRVTETKL